jgi:hypothetical protein
MASPRNRARAFTSLAVLLALLSVGAIARAQAGTFVVSVRTEAGIAAEADHLSGRTLTVVCAATGPQWGRTLAAVGLPAAEADEYYGFSLIPEGEMHLSPYVCDGLRLGTTAASRAANELQVAWSVDVLLHESTHMGRHSYDEALVEACARAGLPGELHRLYGIAFHSPEMRSLTLAAASLRNTQGRAYQGGVCTALGG